MYWTSYATCFSLPILLRPSLVLLDERNLSVRPLNKTQHASTIHVNPRSLDWPHSPIKKALASITLTSYFGTLAGIHCALIEPNR